MKPPSGGPTTGPSRAGTRNQLIAATISSLGMVRSSSRRPTGTIMAPPRPCNRRDATRKDRLWACPHSADPTVKIRMALQKTGLVPKRSATLPLAGMNTARLSM